MRQQNPDCLPAAMNDSGNQGCRPSVKRFGIGTPAGQAVDNPVMPPLGGNKKGRQPPAALARLGARCQQQIRHFLVAMLTRQQQGGLAKQGPVGVDLAFKQHPHHCAMATAGGNKQG